MGQPILLIRVTLSDFRERQFQIDEFAYYYYYYYYYAYHYYVISYSRRYTYPNQWIGNGDDNAIPNNVADLIELIIKRLNLGTADLIGHSYGAFIALYLALEHLDLVRTLVLGEPLAISLLKDDPQYCYPKDVDMIRENAFKHSLVQEAIYTGETEKAVRIFLDGVIGKEGYFYQLTCEARTMIMQNVKSLTGELASIAQHFKCEDAQRVKVPTLLVKAKSPKLLHHITDLHANCLSNNEQTTIPG